MISRVRPDRVPVETGIDATRLYAASQLLTELTSEPVQANKAIVGRNAFAHEAGIHQDGILKDRRTYEIMRPADVGAPSTLLVLGKHSGRHAVHARCRDLGITLSAEEGDVIYRRLMAIAERKKIITNDDLRSLVHEVREHHRALEAVTHDAGYGFGV